MSLEAECTRSQRSISLSLPPYPLSFCLPSSLPPSLPHHTDGGLPPPVLLALTLRLRPASASFSTSSAVRFRNSSRSFIVLFTICIRRARRLSWSSTLVRSRSISLSLSRTLASSWLTLSLSCRTFSCEPMLLR